MGKALRDVYGESLLKYGKNNSSVVVLDSDVSGSTKSGMFGQAYPERFFNVGVAEANMVSFAAGLAAEGFIPFANTFAVFLTSNGLLGARTFGSYSKLNIKLMGGYGGLSDSYDGPTHHALEDIAVMRALPNFEVLVASDAVQVDWLVKYAIDTNKPMYIRLSRAATLPIYEEGEVFERGKAKVIHDGNDLTIVACGLMSGYALQAAKQLETDGVSVRVLDFFSIKPIDREAIIAAATETKGILTVEEHSVIGGLGSAVAEVLVSSDCKARYGSIGMNDCHAECGDYSELLEKYGLSVSNIKTQALALLSKN